jgi:PAS domain-containing protein
MNKMFQQQKEDEPLLWRYLLPALMLPGIAWLDSIISQVILAPFLSLLCLLILALKLRLKTLCYWLVLYAGFVFYVLYQAQSGIEPLMNEATAVVRGASFCLSSLVVYLVCRQREALGGSAHSLLKLVATLPVPVILSDESGLVLFANAQARNKLKIENEAEQLTRTYFQWFSSPNQQGQFIARYLAFMEKGGDVSSPVMLVLREEKEVILNSQWQVLQLSNQRIMITVVLEKS